MATSIIVQNSMDDEDDQNFGGESDRDRDRIKYMFDLLRQQSQDIKVLHQDISREISDLSHTLNQKILKIDRIISFSYMSLSKRLPDHSYYHCAVCNDTFHKSADLIRHKVQDSCWSQYEDLVELKQKLFLCRMCDTLFMDYKQALVHIVTELLIHGFTIPSYNLDLSQCITIIYIEQLHTRNIPNTLSRMKRLLSGVEDPIFDEIDKLEAQIDNEELESHSNVQQQQQVVGLDASGATKSPVLNVSINEFRSKQKIFHNEQSTKESDNNDDVDKDDDNQLSRVQKARGSLVSALVKNKKQVDISSSRRNHPEILSSRTQNAIALMKKRQQNNQNNGLQQQEMTSTQMKQQQPEEVMDFVSTDNSGIISIKQEILEPEISINEADDEASNEANPDIFSAAQGNSPSNTINMQIPPGKLQCEICFGLFSSKDSLRGHKRNRHGILASGRRVSEIEPVDNENKLPCDVCQKYFLNNDSLRSHKRNRHGILANGKQRSIDVKNNESMEEVQQQNTNSKDAENVEVATEENRKYQCVHCEGFYSSKDSLRSHKRISHGILAGKRKSDSFDESEAKKPKSETKKMKKVTPNTADSQRSQPPPSRVSSRHRTPKRLFGIEESVDPQQVSSDDDEEQEEEYVEGGLDQPNGIPEATVETNYDDDNEEEEEDNIRKYLCVHCNGNYSSKDSLRSHKRKAHGILAQKTTYDNENANEEEEVEEEEEVPVGKKFQCDVCQGYYSTKDSLRSHKRIAHGILAGGRRKSDVDEEEINKPFHCEVCSGNYSTKDSLRSHKRIAHGILAGGKKRTDQAVVVNNDSIESEEDMSGSPETSDNESASESKNTLEGHQNYTRAFKLQIIDEAKRMSNNTQVARNHGISEYSVRLWRKNEEKIRTGRTKHAKAQAEVARRAAETDLFMELRLLNLVGDKNEGNLDDPDKKRKILKWAKHEIESLNEESAKLNKLLHMEKAKNMKFKQQMEEIKRPPLKLKIAHGKSSIVDS